MLKQGPDFHLDNEVRLYILTLSYINFTKSVWLHFIERMATKTPTEAV